MIRTTKYLEEESNQNTDDSLCNHSDKKKNIQKVKTQICHVLQMKLLSADCSECYNEKNY